MSYAIWDRHFAARPPVADRSNPRPGALVRGLTAALSLSSALVLAACASQSPLSTASLPTPSPSSNATATGGDVSMSSLTRTVSSDTGVATRTIERSTPRPTKEAMAAASAKSEGPLAEARRLRSKGEKSEALAVLEKAAAADPGNSAITAERGLLALELGQIQTSIGLIRTAAKANPREWRLQSALGSALAAAGRHPEAQTAFARALELAPDHPAVLNNLALSYALDG